MSIRVALAARGALVAIAAVSASVQAMAGQSGDATTLSMESFGKQASAASLGAFRPDQDTVQSLSLYNQMLTYGRCSVSTSKGLVRDALAQPSDNATERFLFTDIVARGQACKGTGLSPIRMLTRGVYAEGLYHASAKKVDYLPVAATDPVYAAFMAGELKHNANLDANDRAMASATNCLVAQQPAIAHDLLASRHGSAAEAQLMDQLFAAGPSCAGPKRQAALNRSFLRAFLANSAYRYWLFRSTEAKG